METIHVMIYIEVYVVALGPSVYRFYNSGENSGKVLCPMHTSQSYPYYYITKSYCSLWSGIKGLSYPCKYSTCLGNKDQYYPGYGGLDWPARATGKLPIIKSLVSAEVNRSHDTTKLDR